MNGALLRPDRISNVHRTRLDLRTYRVDLRCYVDRPRRLCANHVDLGGLCMHQWNAVRYRICLLNQGARRLLRIVDLQELRKLPHRGWLHRLDPDYPNSLRRLCGLRCSNDLGCYLNGLHYSNDLGFLPDRQYPRRSGLP